MVAGRTLRFVVALDAIAVVAGCRVLAPRETPRGHRSGPASSLSMVWL